MILPVHRIIPFSNVEGMGNRTSIFVQGCNSNCLYCHNSETIPMKSKEAKNYTVDELVDAIKGNMPFIRGITVSGGEATLHHKFLRELFIRVKELGLTCYVDSNGFFDKNEIDGLIDVTDKFLLDIKAVGNSLRDLCFSSYMHKGAKLAYNNDTRFIENNEHLENLKMLLAKDKLEEVRLVYVKGFYDEYKVVDKICDIIQPYPQVLLKLIRVHSRGLPEERAIKLKNAVPSKEEIDALALYAKSLGIRNIKTIY